MTLGYAFAFAAWARLDLSMHFQMHPGHLQGWHRKVWACSGCRLEWRRMNGRQG